MSKSTVKIREEKDKELLDKLMDSMKVSKDYVKNCVFVLNEDDTTVKFCEINEPLKAGDNIIFDNNRINYLLDLQNIASDEREF